MINRGPIGSKRWCSSCGRYISVYVPAGGDGSMDIFRIHKRMVAVSGSNRPKYDGPRWTSERCPGSKMEAPNHD